MIMVKCEKVKKYFPIQRGLLRKEVGTMKAVDDVNLQIKKGETFGLVGESGCGKSTLARVVMRLTEPTSGEVIFNGVAIPLKKFEVLLKLRQNKQR